jgi:uncharacterized membrane protein YgcG/chromosome segregation ATPase
MYSIRRLSALATLLGAIYVLSAPAALAFDCDSLVADEAGWFKGDTAKVEAAAQKLVNDGTTVRVRTVADYGKAGSLDAYKLKVQKDCPSWLAPDGGMRNNLIVFMASAAPTHGILVSAGDQWGKRSLTTDVTTAIQNDLMAPRFRERDISGGFIAAIDRAAQLVDLQLHPPAAQGGGQTTIINKTSADYSGVWKIFFWALFMVFVLVFGSIIVRGRTKTREEQRAAQLSAKTTLTACANMINGFDDNAKAIFTAKVNKVAGLLADADATELKSRLAPIVQDFAKAAASFARLGDIAASNPSRDGLSAAEYKQIERGYGAVKGQLDAVTTAKSELEAELAKLQQDAETAPSKISAADSAIKTALQAVADAQSKGYKTIEADNLVVEAKSLLTAAEKDLESKKPGSAASGAIAASRKAAEAVASAQSLPQTKSNVDKKLATLNARQKAAEENATSTRKVFADLEAGYVASSWQSVAGNGTEAEKRIIASAKTGADAAKAASMEVQDWTKASQLTNDALELLGESEKLLKAISDRSKSLADAKAKAPEEINDAEADINKATVYIDEFEADINPTLKTDLATAKTKLAQAVGEMRKRQPDYILVVKTAQAANSAADRIFETASEEHEAVERKKKQLKSLVEEAKRSIDTAQSYISIHASDVSAKASNLLGSARTAYAQGQSARGLDERLKAFKKADENADAALAQAQTDVAEEEERIREAKRAKKRRAEARRQERDNDDNLLTGVVIGALASSGSRDSWGSSPSYGGSSSSDSGSSSGSGSSTDFGNSSSGSGSSSDFGSSSSGSGSSSTW